MTTPKAGWAGLIVSAFVLLAGCGGGNGGGSLSTHIEGTASAGHPVAGTVTVKDGAGTVAGPVAISPHGEFVLPVSGLRPPFLLKAEGRVHGQAVTLYSAGHAAGTININPMTDLAVQLAAGSGLDPLWAAGAHAGALTPARLQAGSDSATRLLLPFLATHGAGQADPFTAPIQLGAGLDAVFDRIAIARDPATGEVTVSSLVNGTTLATAPPAQVDATQLALAGHPPLAAGAPVVLSWYGPSGMAYGTGYDYVSQNIAGTCVRFDPPAAQGVGNVDRKLNIEVLEDMTALTRHLSVSASAKMRMGLYSGSAKASYTSQSVKDSTSVFVAVYSEVIGYTFTVRNPRLDDGSGGGVNWKDKFSSEVATFRASCGDRFMTSITTGGKLVGILKISTSSDKEKAAVTANVKAKSALFNSGSASLRETTSSLMRQYQASITMFETGPADNASPTSFDSFMDAIEAFPDKAIACLGDWHRCAYIVTFADYATISPGSTNIGQQAVAMGILIDYDTRYENMLAQVGDMQARPELYEPTTQDLAALGTRIAQASAIVQQQADRCSDDSGSCKVPEGLLDPATVDLPKRKLITTRTCADYKTNFPGAAIDGEYRMYLASDTQLTAPFYLYCQGMATASPQEFLTLKRTSPPSTSPSYNYSSTVGHGDAYTVFGKLRVLVNASDLAVDRSDLTYATTTWVATSATDKATPFGQSTTSYQHSDWTDAKQGHANVDLTDTPFAISTLTTWVLSGSGAEFTNWHTSGDCQTRPNCRTPIVFGPDRRSVTLHIAGYPGTVKPQADLRLTLAP